MKSVYQMFRVEETERVEDIFSQMDSDADGLISLQEHGCILLFFLKNIRNIHIIKKKDFL